MPNIGARIKRIRESKQYSQYSIAYGAGITQKSLSNIELGKSKPSLDHLYAIAKCLGVSIYDLLPATQPNAVLQDRPLIWQFIRKLTSWWRLISK